MALSDFGFDSYWQDVWHAHGSVGEPARVISEQRGLYRIVTEAGEKWAEVTGAFRHSAVRSEEFPAVGDFVAGAPGTRYRVHQVLPRRSSFVRKAAGLKPEAQVVAANVDTALVVQAAGLDFNPRRLERYLAVAWQGGARPVVVLNKIDTAEDLDEILAAAAAVSAGVPVLPVSAHDGTGMTLLEPYLAPRQTAVFLGSSGVGKSTLINFLLDAEQQVTGDVRAGDQRGRHTTTHRELFSLPNGALVVDTPGMRELSLWDGGYDGIDTAFSDVAYWSERCRYRDCRHQGEPGCAVLAAVQTGDLDDGRLEAHQKLLRELAYAARKEDSALRAVARRRWKQQSAEGRSNRQRKMGDGGRRGR